MEPELLIQLNTYLYVPYDKILDKIYDLFEDEGNKEYVKSDIIKEFKTNTEKYLESTIQFYTNSCYDDINNLNDIISQFTKYVSNLSYLKNTFE